MLPPLGMPVACQDSVRLRKAPPLVGSEAVDWNVMLSSTA